MRHLVLLIWLGVLVVSGCSGAPNGHLIEEGRSAGQIVLATDDAPTRHAAEELQRYLAKATGATVPISMVGGRGPEVLVGWGDEAIAAAPDLAPDAFVFRSDGNRLIIGGPEQGTLYGVYAFLEEYVGIRRYTPAVTVVPELTSFDLPRLDETYSPAFPVRWLHMPCAEDQAWCDWHGIHSRDHRNESWGMFVHTFNKLVPPEKYFAEHPEYFSEIQGQRLDNQQICLTNEDVFQLVVEGLREGMAKRPESKLWSVSQNDCFGPCECADCQVLVDKHGGQAGPLIVFVNRVAEEFPDKTISTLAYQYTRHAPKDLVPAPNVNICLCSIECDRAEPLGEGKRDADFRRDVREWSALTRNLMIWDYVVQFSNYVSPFPNFPVLQPNIQMFRDANVQLMFQQGSGASRSDFSELKQYVIAKLLWDPDRNVDALIDDFVAGYYEAAAGGVRSYFDLMHECLLSSGATLSIYGSPAVQGESWLSPETLLAADEILLKAERSVQAAPEALRRVFDLHLSLVYARLEQAKRHGYGEYGLFEKSPAGAWQVKPEWVNRLDDFVTLAKDGGFLNVHERKSPPDEYAAQIRAFFSEGMVDHRAVSRPIELTEPLSPKYPADGIATLTDGIKGTTDYRFNWLGWEAVDTTMTVDLGESKEVRRVAADFLQVVISWIWMPTEVRWSTSEDGETWEPAGVIRTRTPNTERALLTERFESSFPARQARFVRLEVTGIKYCPSWHHAAGGDAWFFCDEVMVFER